MYRVEARRVPASAGTRRGVNFSSMDSQSPIPTPGTSRDPFELDRLADELEAREHSLDAPSHDLPLYPPLAHDNTFFTASTFNVEDFLLSRVHTSLPDLRAELRDYLAVLKEELVQLINDDYEAFISLSTDLKGEGARLERLKWPLNDLKSQILVGSMRSEFCVVFPTEPGRNPVKNSLVFRTPFKASSNSGLPFVTRRSANCILPRFDLTTVLQTYLHLLLKISESIARLESLLLIASPEGPSSPELKNLPIKSLAAPSEDSDNRCGLPHHVPIFAHV